MLDPKDQHEMEQAQAFICETIPPLLWEFYQKLTKQGFSESQAMELTKQYLHSSELQGE